ncbi:MAG: NAD(P)-dependent oxidoreductase [Archaeoglobaceae archaeon]
MEKIAVVGGSGFIGSWVVKGLSSDYNVVIVDVKEPRAGNYGADFRRCDIRSYASVEECLRDADLVINTAVVQIPKINEEKKLGYEVNIVGAQNVCEAVYRNPSVRGLIHAGSWHVIGEVGIVGTVDEAFGYRPDKVEDRARLYVLSKIAQEVIVRYYDEMDGSKVYSVIRLGTVLGEGMPEGTAASIFINRALKGEPITPYRHSMYRPMLFVDIRDVVEAFRRLAAKILDGELSGEENSINHVINFFHPEPVTIIELAHIVKRATIEVTRGAIDPPIQVVDLGYPQLFEENSKTHFRVNISKAQELLKLENLIPPDESIKRLVKLKYSEKITLHSPQK